MGEPGFLDFMNETPLFFKIFGGVVLLLVISSFLFVFIRGIKTWNANQHAEVAAKKSKIVDKRTEVWGGTGSSSTNTNYYITFEFEDRSRTELPVKANQFGLLVIGDSGVLAYRGTRFLEFKRMME